MTQTKGFGVEQWVEMFREIGLDETAMHRWHAIFERRFPDAHQSFMEWLKAPAADIDRVRESSRTQWAQG